MRDECVVAVPAIKRRFRAMQNVAMRGFVEAKESLPRVRWEDIVLDRLSSGRPSVYSRLGMDVALVVSGGARYQLLDWNRGED